MEEKKTKHKVFLWIALIFLLGIGSFFVLNKKQEKTTSVSQPETPTVKSENKSTKPQNKEEGSHRQEGETHRQVESEKQQVEEVKKPSLQKGEKELETVEASHKQEVNQPISIPEVTFEKPVVPVEPAVMVDKTALNQLIFRLEPLLNRIKYTEASPALKQAFNHMLAKARAVQASEVSNQTDIDMMVLSLQESYDQLNGMVDKNHLVEQVDWAMAIKNQIKYIEASQELKQAFDELLQQAQAVLSNPEASQMVVNEIKDRLHMSYEQLDGRVTKQELGDLLERVQLVYNQVLYTEATPSVKQAFDHIVEEAKRVYGDETVIQKEIDSMVNQLQTHYHQLDGKVDKQALDEEIGLANSVKSTIKYINASEEIKHRFDTVLEEAMQIFNDPQASRLKVHQITETLQSAYQALDGTVDKTRLEELLNEAKQATMTSELETAIAQGQAIFDQPEASQQQVQEAIQMIEEALYHSQGILDPVAYQNLKQQAPNSVVTQFMADGEVRNILWVKGVQPPLMKEDGSGDFKKDTTIGSYVEYLAPFKHDAGWYDVNKSRTHAADESLCFAATAANSLHWWLEQNKEWVDRYLAEKEAKGDFAEFDAETSSATRDLRKMIHSFESQQKSFIFQKFQIDFGNKTNGYYVDNVEDFFINGHRPKENGGTNVRDAEFEKDPRAGFFNDVFGTTLLTDRRFVGSYDHFGRDVKNMIAQERIIAIQHTAFSQYVDHVITLWGAEYNAQGQIKAIYITDSDDQYDEARTGMKRLLVKEVNGRPRTTSSIDPNVRGAEISYLYTLDLGTQKWQAYFNQK